MKVDELAAIISPVQDVQVFDSRTMEPLTGCNYMADSACEAFSCYGDTDIYAIAPKISKDGNCYIAIIVEVNP